MRKWQKHALKLSNEALWCLEAATNKTVYCMHLQCHFPVHNTERGISNCVYEVAAIQYVAHGCSCISEPLPLAATMQRMQRMSAHASSAYSAEYPSCHA